MNTVVTLDKAALAMMVGPMLDRAASAVDKTAGDLIGGEFSTRIVGEGLERYVVADDPRALVREYGTIDENPNPWGWPAIVSTGV